MRMTNKPPSSNLCRHTGCTHPRTRLSLFCTDHHREHLDHADQVVDLPPKERTRLVTGPRWLDLIRVVGTSTAVMTLSFRPAILVASSLAIASTIIGVLFSRRAIWLPDERVPVVMRPPRWFFLPVFGYALAVTSVTFLASIAAVRLLR